MTKKWPNPWAAVQPAGQQLTPCQQGNADEWFATDSYTNQTAAALCHFCPVRAPCLKLATDSPHQQHGVWGGKAPQQIKELRLTNERNTA